MKIRTQLALSFLLFTIGPVAGLTLYSYSTSIRAFRNVVQEESAGLAKEMSHRMEVVTRDLRRRIHQLDRRPFYQLRAERLGKDRVPPPDVYVQVLSHMGDMAAYVDSLEIPAPTHDPSRQPLPGVVAPPLPPPPKHRPRPPLPDLRARAMVKSGSGTGLDFRQGELPAKPDAESVVVFMDNPPAWINGTEALALAMKIEQQKRRMHSIMELKIGQQNGSTGAQKGEADAPIKAQIRADEIVARIFERGRFVHGEIQFAVDKEGKVHSPNPEQAARIEKLGLTTAQGKPAVLQSCPQDWIVATAFEPVSGMTFGIARPIGGSLQEIKATALRNLGIGLGFVALAFLGVVPISGRLTRGLSVLAKGVERLSRGDLEARVPVRSGNEIGALAAAFNQMASDLAQQQKQLVEQESLQKELEMCRRIQEVLLPREPLKVGFAEARGISIPARQVGGDFFNYFVLPEGDVAVLMGDVSGKGVPAALLMANLQARLQARLQVERDLARLADEMDMEVSRQTEPQTFVTLFMGIVSRDGRKLRWVNAGHNPQYVLGVDGRVQALGATGKPIGLLPGEGFQEHQVDLGKGDFLFLYTDGLVEAEDPQGEEFGSRRLESILMKERGFNSDRIVGDIVEAVSRHRGGTEAGDDATLLALKVA